MPASDPSAESDPIGGAPIVGKKSLEGSQQRIMIEGRRVATLDKPATPLTGAETISRHPSTVPGSVRDEGVVDGVGH
ncbi:MAG: hypothetical protein ACR2KG_05540 [Nocardioidaceae bacterium]